jgi:hypothetical protein
VIEGWEEEAVDEAAGVRMSFSRPPSRPFPLSARLGPALVGLVDEEEGSRPKPEEKEANA